MSREKWNCCELYIGNIGGFCADETERNGRNVRETPSYNLRSIQLSSLRRTSNLFSRGIRGRIVGASKVASWKDRIRKLPCPIVFQRSSCCCIATGLDPWIYCFELPEVPAQQQQIQIEIPSTSSVLFKLWKLRMTWFSPCVGRHDTFWQLLHLLSVR